MIGNCEITLERLRSELLYEMIETYEIIYSEVYNIREIIEIYPRSPRDNRYIRDHREITLRNDTK